MLCNDDRILPVARHGSAAATFLAFSGSDASRDQVPGYLSYPCAQAHDQPAADDCIPAYQQNELSEALKLSPHVFRYDPMWQLPRPFKSPQSATARSLDKESPTFHPTGSGGSGAKLAESHTVSAVSFAVSKKGALSSQAAAKACGAAPARAANAQPKTHRVTRPTSAAMHRRRSPHAVIDLLTKNAWTVDFCKNETPHQAGFKSKPAELNELQYLVAYNLVNNFYFNLVSWSPVKKSIAIAIDSKAYWWNGSGMVEDISALRTHSVPISCISCSSSGYFAVASLDGLLSVYSASRPQLHMTRAFTAPLFTVCWFPDGVHLLAGDSGGKIFILRFLEGKTLEVISQLYGLTQQICGFALNATCTEVAAGANENLAIVWDISNLKKPLLKCKLPHTSAVKGISFCPWAPGLLATGGGSNDRHLRYWHTGSGQMLGAINTKRQITSVFWSSQVKQILVTFGYSTCPEHVVAAVYAYPGKIPVAEARSREPLRALSASVAPDETSVAVAANDGTVRVYNLWPKRVHSLTQAAASGSYGSAIIEAAERVDVKTVFR